MSGRPATSSTSLFFIADSCPGFATRMLCAVFFSHCASDNDTTFGMFFRDPNERLVLLPCSVTERFPKHFASDFLNFRAHGHRYVVYVYTGSDNKKRIGGDDLSKFMKDFNLGLGQLVVFVMTGCIAKAFVCSFGAGFIDGGGAGVAQQEEEQGGADEEGHVDEEGIDVEIMGEAPIGIIYSMGVSLDLEEEGRLAMMIDIEQGNIASRFVHRFTSTNIMKKSMKIPNQVCVLLNIGAEGFIGVRLGEGPLSRVAFKTAKDGRMVFNKEWGVFVSTYNLQVGSAAMFTFSRSNAAPFDVVCVVDILSI